MYETAGGHSLVLYGTEADHRLGPRLAKETDCLLSWLGTPRPFHIYLWWRQDPRQLSKDAWPSRRTVNGGWTSVGSSAIFVYRAEEWDRVVLHEMIHALEWDWKMPTDPLPCWGLSTQAEVYPALFEAWTELLAEWLWCVWNKVPWTQQRAWQDEQAVQILARQRGPWNENTSVFAYYVLKAALAPHMALLWVHGNGHVDGIRDSLLCSMVEPELATLRSKASRTVPKDISLRMTKVESNRNQ